MWAHRGLAPVRWWHRRGIARQHCEILRSDRGAGGVGVSQMSEISYSRRSDTSGVLHIIATLNGIKVEVYHHSGSRHANQDRWMLQPFGDTLRVAVVDGVTPWRTHQRAGDAAQWAAAVCVKHLLLPGDLLGRLVEANDDIHDPSVAPSRRQAMAAVAAVDLCIEGGQMVGDCAVAADCEVWEAVDGLKLIAGGDFLRPDVRERVRQQHDRWMELSLDERKREEADLLESPDTQICHAVGRYRAPTFSVERLQAPCVVLATDGARIGEAVASGATVDDIPTWLQTSATHMDRDDLTCVVITAA